MGKFMKASFTGANTVHGPAARTELRENNHIFILHSKYSKANLYIHEVTDFAHVAKISVSVDKAEKTHSSARSSAHLSSCASCHHLLL